MKVDAYQAKDGTLHLSEDAQILYDRRAEMKALVTKLSAAAMLCAPSENDSSGRMAILDAADMEKVFMELVEHFNDDLIELASVADAIRALTKS